MTLSGHIEPMKDRTANRLDLVNEMFVILFTYHLYPLTEFMTDVDTRGIVGTSLVYLTFVNIAINLGLLLIRSILGALRKCKLNYLEWK